MNKEIRAFNFDVRAEENEEHGHHLIGQPIVYDERTDMGWYDEIIDNGALTDTDLKDVRFLVNHNTDMIPLARSRNNNVNSTMQMEVVEGRGMSIRVDLDTENNADAKSLWSAVGRGDITGMSFMFTVDKDLWENLESDYPTRHILSIGKVFEASVVTFPAYEQTSVGVREQSDAIDKAIEEQLKRECGGGSDDDKDKRGCGGEETDEEKAAREQAEREANGGETNAEKEAREQAEREANGGETNAEKEEREQREADELERKAREAKATMRMRLNLLNLETEEIDF